MIWKALRVLPLLLLCAASLFAQPSQPPLSGAERTRWFREAKFGIFIHWGAYSVIGRHEWARNRFQIPQAEYDTYVRQFNPVRFDPDAWVSLAQNAGAKYMVITSKHHDGFSIFRSEVSKYDMKLTPYEGDPLKMLAEAARRKGMRLGFYHSIMDWENPDYIPKRPWEAADPQAGGNLPRYIQFMEAQLRELLTHYGDVADIWFDGEWEHSTDEMHSDQVLDLIHKLQPNTLVNDRLYKRKPGSRADFGTPEQFIPATGVLDPSGKPALWEACVTINQDSWGYNKYETQFKTERDLIRMLVEVVSKGGNLLLNIGPKPDGTIQDEFITRLNAMGRWMKVNHEAIYATTASPFTTLPFFGRATTKGNTLYLHVFQWPKDGKLQVPVSNGAVNAHLLTDPGRMLAVTRGADGLTIALPATAPDEIASVVALTLDGPPKATDFRIQPDPSGVITMSAASAEIQSSLGQKAKLENALGHVFLTSWSRPADVPVWTISVPMAARYKVDLVYAAEKASAGTRYSVTSGSSQVTGQVLDTQGSWVFKRAQVGEVELKAGAQTIQIKTEGNGGVEAMNLESVILTPSARN